MQLNCTIFDDITTMFRKIIILSINHSSRQSIKCRNNIFEEEYDKLILTWNEFDKRWDLSVNNETKIRSNTSALDRATCFSGSKKLIMIWYYVWPVRHIASYIAIFCLISSKFVTFAPWIYKFRLGDKNYAPTGYRFQSLYHGGFEFWGEFSL